MDEENIEVMSSTRSPRQQSFTLRDFPSPLASVVNNQEPVQIIRQPSRDTNSPVRTPITVTSRSSPTKGSVHISLKGDENNKKNSISILQSDKKSQKSYTSLNPVHKDNKSQKSINLDIGTVPVVLEAIGADQKNIVQVQENIIQSLSEIEPKGNQIGEQIDELSESIKELSKNLEQSQTPVIYSNIGKITNMSKILTNEAEALRASIKSLSQDIVLCKQDLNSSKEDVNFPYHLFLIEIILNTLNMKCDCFEIDFHNLVIEATFLGKEPIILYDSTYGNIDDLRHLNVGKSALFAMTYDKICSIKDFIIEIQLTRQPPCSTCVTKIAETKFDVTKEFVAIREELCQKWVQEQPKDNITCTASSSLKKHVCYLKEDSNCDPIGVAEITTRVSFLGKEITTVFSASSKQMCTSTLMKDEHGVSMYSCQKVEMDGQGNVLLNEDILTKKVSSHYTNIQRIGSPISEFSDPASNMQKNQNKGYNNYVNNYREDMSKYDEIFTKMNTNELKIRVPKSTKIERTGKYDKIQELCSCENTPYNTGEQIQFELPKYLCYADKTHHNYSSNLKYTFNGCDRACENKDRKIINVTPSNCPVPINVEKAVNSHKDVFILKIGKKLQTKDKKTDLEIELVTPKSNFEKPADNHISTQSSSNTLTKTKSKDSKKKSKGKKGKKKSKTNLSKKKSQTNTGGKSKKRK